MRVHCQSIGENYVRASRYLWTSLLLLLVATSQASAQSNVDPRLERLEEVVRALERRVADLEEQLRKRSAPASEQLRQQSAPASVAPDKVNWRKLHRGMSEGEVRMLLGSPSKVNVHGSFTIWHYGFPSGGQVQFDGRNLDSWREP